MTRFQCQTFKIFLFAGLLFFSGSLTLRAQNDSFYNGKSVRIGVTGYQGGSEIDLAVERGELVYRNMDVPPIGSEPARGYRSGKENSRRLD